MLAATAIAANFFMMCGLPKMPFRAGETFPSRERRDLAVPHESSTKIIEMVGAGGILSFDRNNHGNSHFSLVARITGVAAQSTTFDRNRAGSTLSDVPSGAWWIPK